MGTAAAASASCDAINANPTVHWTGSSAGAGNNTSYPIGSFAAGEYVTATFTDYGTTDPDDPMAMGDSVFLNRANMQNEYVYRSDSGGSAGSHTLTAPTEFLMQYGLFVSVQDTRGLISPATLQCHGAAATIVLGPTTVPNATYGQSYTTQLTASGGTAPYTFTLVSGATPSGISVSAGGSLTGQAQATGSFTFQVKATDSAATPSSGTRSYTMTVNGTVPASPSAASAQAGDASALVSFSAPANSGGSPITSYTVESTPGQVTATGSGSPITVTGLTNGTAYTFHVIARNSVGDSAASAESAAVTPLAQQTITFGNPGSQNYGTSPTLTATSSSGLPVSFAASTTNVCTITSGGTLTFAGAGTCTINAGQGGNGTYSPAAPVSRSFTVQPVVPGAPTMGSVSVGNQQATVSFTAPGSNGGAAITGYTVTSNPGGLTATGAGSPITLTGLTNGTAYTFTVTADNAAGTGASSSASASVVPRNAQTISFPNPGTVNFGATLALSASASSGLTAEFASATTSVCTVSASTLTAIAPGTCTVTASQPGNAAYLPAAPVAQSFAVVVPGGAVGVSTTSVPSAIAGKPYSATLSAAGGAAPYTWSLIGALPAGLSLSPAGVISGNPTAVGTFSVQVQVTDAASQTDNGVLQLVIDAPTLAMTPATLPSAKVGDAYQQTLTATGGTAPYQFAVTTGALPAGLILTNAGQLGGTPTGAGSFAASITATDANGFSVAHAYTVVVSEDAPMPAADAVSTGANTAASIPVTTNDAGQISSIAIAQAPAHGTATVDGLAIVYTPAKAYFGTDTLTYTATGPGGTSQAATVTITVKAGALPTVTARTLTLQAGKRLTIDATEGASHGPFTGAALVSTPASGTVTVNGTTLVYTADASVSGKVSFDYTLSNAFGASAAATITVQINPTPVAPSINEATVAGNAATVDITAGATGGPFTAAAVVSVQPANAGVATVAQTASGYALNFVANELFSGTASVSYTLSNAFATSARSVVRFAVQGRSDPSKDAEVVGILSAQADATRRMATGQINNFQRRLEQLHNGQPATGFSNGITLTSASASSGYALQERQRGPSAIEDLSATTSNMVADNAAAAPTGKRAGLLPGGASVWTGGAVNFGKAGSTRGDTSTDFTTTGLSMGADKLFADGLIIGAGVGYGRDDTDVGSDISSSRVESYSAAVYASYRPTDAFFVDSLVGYQWLSLDSVRRVTDNDGRVTGSRDGRQWFGSLSAGYLLRTRDIQVTPYGRFDVAQASLDRFAEQGDVVYALSYQSQTVRTSTASAGVLAQFTVKRDYGVWAPQLRAEYGRDLEGASNALMSYADLVGGNVYRAKLLQQSRDHALLGGGFSLQTLGGWVVSAEYQVQLQSDSTGDNQSIRIGFEKKFDH